MTRWLIKPYLALFRPSDLRSVGPVCTLLLTVVSYLKESKLRMVLVLAMKIRLMLSSNNDLKPGACEAFPIHML